MLRFASKRWPKKVSTSFSTTPPRLARAGDLYGAAFYRQLRRVIRSRGGRLFHYTGEPHRRYRPKRIVEGIVRRLQDAGFRQVRFEKPLAGVLARV